MKHTALEVLLIDPYSTISYEFERELQAYNAHVLRFHGMRDVSHVLRTHTLAAVFVSLNQCQKQAITLIQRVHASPQHQHIPITVFAPKADRVLLEHACRAGARHYVIEPYLRSHLRNVLQAMQGIFSTRHAAPASQRTIAAPLRVPCVITQGNACIIGTTHDLNTRGLAISTLQPVVGNKPFYIRFPTCPNIMPTVVKRVEWVGRLHRRIGKDKLVIAFTAENGESMMEMLAWWIQNEVKWKRRGGAV